MHVAESENTVDVRFIALRRNRISKEYHKVNVVVCNLCAKLLFTAEMSGKIFMDAEECGFLNKSAASA